MNHECFRARLSTRARHLQWRAELPGRTQGALEKMITCEPEMRLWGARDILPQKDLWNSPNFHRPACGVCSFIHWELLVTSVVRDSPWVPGPRAGVGCFCFHFWFLCAASPLTQTFLSLCLACLIQVPLYFFCKLCLLMLYSNISIIFVFLQCTLLRF